MMKIEEIEAIARIMSENDLSEFRIDVDDCKLCMRRGAKVVAAAGVPAVAAAPVAAPVAAAPAPAEAASSPAAEKQETIDSPLAPLLELGGGIVAPLDVFGTLVLPLEWRRVCRELLELQKGCEGPFGSSRG